MQAKPVQQETPPLPEERFTKTEPFLVTRVDFAGPLYVKESGHQRAYIALFTCATTWAVENTGGVLQNC